MKEAENKDYFKQLTNLSRTVEIRGLMSDCGLKSYGCLLRLFELFTEFRYLNGMERELCIYSRDLRDVLMTNSAGLEKLLNSMVRNKILKYKIEDKAYIFDCEMFEEMYR